MKLRRIILFFTILLSPFCIDDIDAQTAATLTGRVTDEQRSAVSGANVEATNISTNNVLTTMTNSDGLYTFSEIQPGNYRIRVQQSGFQTTAKENIALNVTARVTEDFILRVGEMSATVTVDSGPTLIERDSPTVSTVVTREFVENIPLNGRSFQSLLELTPGVVLTPATATNPGQFSVNGQRTNSNYFTLDGVSANSGTTPIATSSQQAAGTLPSTTVLGGFNNLASVDELQEFRVQTSVFAPEFGRTPGAQVSLLSRSGTNTLYGSVFDYVRNDRFDANTFFNNRSNIPRGKLRQNDFGFTVGGPVFLPRFGEGTPYLYDGRNRTFFFVSYEGLRLRQPVFRSANVPSQAARDRAVALGLTNISTLLAAYPLPNATPTTTDPLIGRFEQSISNPISVDSVGIRIDHNITSKFSVFGRYKRTPSSSDQATTAFPNQTNYYQLKTDLFTFGRTYAASSKIALDVRGNYTDDSADYLFTGQAINGAVLPELSSFLPAYASEEAASVSLQFGSLINQTRGRSFGNGQKQLNLVGSATFVAGNHQIKFGGDYRRLSPKVVARSYGFTYNFGSLAAVLDQAANSTTRGTVLVSVQALAPAGKFLFENYSAFGQDTWRVNPRLTLTYGARWDVNLPPSSDGALPYAINGLDNLLTASLAPAGTKAFKATYNNFAPRVGTAYTIDRDGGFVIRGGFGVFNDLAIGQATRGYTSFPFSSVSPSTRVTFIPGSAALQATLQPAPFNTNPPYASEFYVYNQNIKLPYTLQYNVAVEKSLGSRQSVSITYVGSRGRRLLFTEALRNTVADAVLPIPAKQFLNPIFGNGVTSSNVYITDNRGKSDYNALQIQFERRLSRGLQVISSYTYAKSNDNISSEIAASAGVFRVNPDVEYAPSDFDIRHTFTAAVTYKIPSFIKEGIGKAIFGGFAVDLITRARSAPPYNAFVSYQNTSAGTSFITRPDVNTSLPLYVDDPNTPGGRKVNLAALTAAPVTRQGTLGRNALRAFSLYQSDVSLRREFNLGEKARLQLRAEAFNVLNQSNFAADSSTYLTVTRTGTTQNLTFGQANTILANQLSGSAGTGFNSLYTVGGARSLQFAAKILF